MRARTRTQHFLPSVVSTLDLSSLSTVALRAGRDVLDMALAAESLFKVLGLELTMLVVAVGLLDRVRDGVEDVRGLLEDVVHFFERTVTSLGEEEVHRGEDESVAVISSVHAQGLHWLGQSCGSLHDSEDNVCSVPDVRE